MIKETKKQKTDGKTERKSEKKVSKKKLETVKKLVELIKSNSTVMIASIKNLPSRQFQNIRKKLKGKAEVIVVKKRIMLKSLEESQEENIKKLEKYICEDSAIIFSKEDPFDLAGILAENKNPLKAKPGQEAVEDIVVNEGPTDLAPGQAISELGALGIKIGVEEGKIAVKEKKIIVKAGEKINENAAAIMAKLDIIPFEIGLEPLAIYDSKTGQIYTDVKIDKKKTIEELRTNSMKALGLAQKIVYYCKETIGFLLAKANAEAGSLSKLSPMEEKAKNTDEKKEEIKQEDVQKTEENKSEERK